jgi:serine/threonine protein kinase
MINSFVPTPSFTVLWAAGVPDPGWAISWGGIFLLFIAATLGAGIMYAFFRKNHRRNVPRRPADFDPTAFREQLVEQIVRDAGGEPSAFNDSRPQHMHPPMLPRAAPGRLFGFTLLTVIVVVIVLGTIQSIKNAPSGPSSGNRPSGDEYSTAEAAPRGIRAGVVLGVVSVVLIGGLVVFALARFLLFRSASLGNLNQPQVLPGNRSHTPFSAPQHSPGPRQCPVCESAIPDDSPEGLCPKCLLSRCMKPDESPVLSPVVGETTPYRAPAPAPLPADLAAKFPGLEILESLGQGGMGAVYKARQTKLDRLVAVKVLPEEWGKDPAFAERFAREAKALARLNHPHIVAVHDFGQSEGHFYLVMEFVDGANLRNILAGGGLEPNEALAIIPQICDALQYAHEEGVVHRDIKPENILLDSKGRVKIADFGLAKLIDKPRANFTLTGSQMVMGTLDYMAPEQRLTPQQVDHRADIYSLGVVFYEMLTGELPLGRFAPPSQKSGVDRRLDGIVFRALEREPGQRYQRISDVKTDLSAVVAGRSAPSPRRGVTLAPEPEPQVLCVPIHLGSAWDQHYPGLLRLEAETLVLEYAASSIVRSKFKEKTLPLRMLRQLQLSRHWYGTYLSIQTASLKILEGIPTGKQGRLVLGLLRRDFAAAKGMLEAIERKAPELAITIHAGAADSPDSPDMILQAARPPAEDAAGKAKLKMGHRIKSMIGAVYTMFISRAKNPEPPTNDPAHEHAAG